MNRYGCRPDRPDARDHVAPLRLAFAEPSPPIRVDLRPRMPQVYDQGGLGSCTANAVTAAIASERGLEAPLSRLFVYWGARRLELSEGYDSGCEIRDALKIAASGVPLEKYCQYSDADPGPYLERPGDDVYSRALGCHVESYHRLDGRGAARVDQLRLELAGGHPVVFGFSVPASFERGDIGSTGIMQVPAPDERTVGGHAVLAVGYDDAASMVLVRNSWGAGWGQGGHFWMPYSIFSSDLVFDVWTLRA